MLTCTNCSHRAMPFAFRAMLPLTEAQQEAAIRAGATLPDPPLIAEPCYLCPACTRLVQLTDDAGLAVAPIAPPESRTSVLDDVERIVRREAGLPPGRMRHGDALDDRSSGGRPAG